MTSDFHTFYEEFYRSKLFSAESLMTRWGPSILKIQENPSIEDKKLVIEEGKKRNISSVVVCKNMKPIGYSVLKYWKLDTNKPALIRFGPGHRLKPSGELQDIVLRFYKVSQNNDKTVSPPIFIVEDSEPHDEDPRKPIGIMTYWDLNRRSVYSYFYSIFVFLEQSLKNDIYESHRDGHSDCVKKYVQHIEKNRKRKRKFKGWDKELHYNIARLSFSELLKFKRRNCHRGNYGVTSIPIDILESMNKIRNKIAHPVNLVLDSGLSRTQQQLEYLKKLCTEGKKIVIETDTNPKNAIHSSPPIL